MEKSNEELFKCYIDNTASDEDRHEFFRRLKEGLYDEIHEADYDILTGLAETTNDEEVVLERIRERLQAKIIARKKKTQRVWIAAAATFFIVALAGIWFLTSSKGETITTYSHRQIVKLPDGSTAILNDSSEIHFESSFGDESREIYLTGEASFYVRHDPDKPFVVHAGKISTRVLGTEFNVNARGPKVIVTVARGVVEVNDDKQILSKISADQQIEVDLSTSQFVKKDSAASEALAWQREYVEFDGITLYEAALMLEAKYNVTILFEEDALKEYRIFGKFLPDEALNEVLDIMSTVMRLEYITNASGDTVIFKENQSRKSE